MFLIMKSEMQRSTTSILGIKIFLYGNRKIGKTMLLNNILKKTNLKQGGFKTLKVSDREIMFTDISDGEGITFFIDDDPQKIATIFDRDGVSSLISAVELSDIIVMDELGFLESKAEKFKTGVMNTIDSFPKIIGILKKYRKNSFWDTITKRKDIILYEVTKENRDKLADEIAGLLNEKK